MSASVAAAAVTALRLQDLDYWNASQVFDFMTWADGFDFTQVLRDDITPTPQNVLEMWCHLRFGDPPPVELEVETYPFSPLELRRRAWNKVRRTVAMTVWQRDMGLCQLCGEALTDSEGGYTIDHIIPISLGGTDDLDNLQLACRSCNSRKGNRP